MQKGVSTTVHKWETRIIKKFWFFLFLNIATNTSKCFNVDPKGNDVNVKFYFHELCKYFCPRTLNCPLKVIELICILSDFFPRDYSGWH